MTFPYWHKPRFPDDDGRSRWHCFTSRGESLCGRKLLMGIGLPEDATNEIPKRNKCADCLKVYRRLEKDAKRTYFGKDDPGAVDPPKKSVMSDRITLRPGSTFSDIPEFPRFNYRINVAWNYIESCLADWAETGLELDPDFQRAHVWTLDQREAYLEYSLRGGEVGRNITFCTMSEGHWEWGPITLVDGKQRLETARMFMRGELKAFGLFRSQFTGHMRIYQDFVFRVCNLPSREDILQLYLNINAGGTPHTTEELDKVRELLKRERDGAAKL